LFIFMDYSKKGDFRFVPSSFAELYSHYASFIAPVTIQMPQNEDASPHSLPSRAKCPIGRWTRHWLRQS
jgi:hypothetical protein